MKLARKKKSAGKAAVKLADYSLLLEPVVTEKSSSFVGNKVVFKVPLTATKPEIRGAIERVFGVNVVQLNTCNYMGKRKRSARASGGMGRRKHFKKAYVTLKAGQSISVVEGL